MRVIEPKNIVFTPDDEKEYQLKFDGTKKKFTDLLEEYMTSETIFRPLKFKIFIQNKGYYIKYEAM